MFGILLASLCFSEAPAEEIFHLPFCLSDGSAQQMLVRHVPAESTRAPVILLHFASGHSGRMMPLARRLAERGYPAYAIDLLGHGLSSKGVPVYDDTILGVRKLAEMLVERHQCPAVGLGGTSMGAEIAIHFLLKQELETETAGTIPLVGSVVAQGVIAPWQRDIAWRFSLPTFYLFATEPIPYFLVSPPIVFSDWMIPPRRIYRSSELRRDFRQDPLRKRYFPSKVAVQATRYRETRPSGPVPTPLLVIQGTRDRLVRRKYGERTFDGLSRYFSRAELILLPEASHGVYEEDPGTIADLMDEWFSQTLPPPDPEKQTSLDSAPSDP